jgi:hypothetical protein
MGLFDTLRCERPVPLTDGMAVDADWQTKPLGCTLSETTLTAQGRLLQAEGHDTGFHGVLHFHGPGSSGLPHRLEAKFTDGQLLHLLPAQQAQYSDEGLRLQPEIHAATTATSTPGAPPATASWNCSSAKLLARRPHLTPDTALFDEAFQSA